MLIHIQGEAVKPRTWENRNDRTGVITVFHFVTIRERGGSEVALQSTKVSLSELKEGLFYDLTLSATGSIRDGKQRLAVESVKVNQEVDLFKSFAPNGKAADTVANPQK